MSLGVLLCQRCQAEFKPANSYYCDGYLEVDAGNWRVNILGLEVQLTATQYRLLHCLVANRGCKLEYAQILRSVWGDAYRNDIDFVRIYVCQLRKKIEPDPKHPSYIITAPGVGYYFKVKN